MAKALRFLSSLLIVTGLGLCVIVATYYLRAPRAQREGRQLLEERSSSAAGEAKASRGSPSPEAALPSEDPVIRSAVATNYPVGEPLARLRISLARMDYVVFAGSDRTTLARGPGHVPGSALPGEEGGANNCVITGHRDTHFRRLGWLRRGHLIELETPLGKQSYRVISREVVDPSEVRFLKPTDKPRLTLITCYPFTYIGPAPRRLVVVAEPDRRRS